MEKKLNLAWFYAAGIRALRTVAQTAVSFITVGAALNEIQWTKVISVALVAGIYSLLTSLATELPELATDGSLLVDSSKANMDTYRLILDSPLDDLKDNQIVKFKVSTNADLSQPNI